ncbi:TorD/DmsD family molecular chaperone [Adlercreutzia faecimuris]|uniref:Molecular chaperone TorD family protein n=1 Tax=Adlercreutzia faecimuris TaxID=2897341 RepID=A0ABS9WHS3_9ACTN|nr:molecular chaperone TorD family protein [Adlercreutzia sp. JBNU-10]MCI2242428.1 molecular chaperone TorD family protein [Adlercreutzia sp. JBNU-10]
MSALQPADHGTLADAYAFLGNSLLKPLSQTPAVGLDPAFWAAFPDFGSDAVAAAADALARWAAEDAGRPDGDRVRDVSVEYTRLFIGPPKPAAPPWETMGRGEGVTVGFGDPTFEMRRLLREAGLELSNENRQYEDHLGIELLYLSELCRRAAEAAADGRADEAARLDVQAAAFAAEHPLAWIDALRAQVAEAAPGGYYALLLALARTLLALQVG